VNSAAATGGRIHEALAVIYVPDGQIPGDPVATLVAAQERDQAIYDAQLHDVVDDVDGLLLRKMSADLTSAFDLERAMITGYVEWLEETGADQDIEVIAPEVYVEAEINVYDAGPTRLIGKIDARVRSRITGRRLFIDHKTVGTFLDPQLGLNRQMLHYHLIEFLGTTEGEERCDGALYNMLRKVKRTRASKPPFYERRMIPHNIHEFNAYKAQIKGIITRMIDVESALRRHVSHHAVVPPRPSRDCHWKCPFFKVCRMFDDGSRVEAAIEEHYERQDPLSYYGREEVIED
jgi:hypothetical protein